MNWDLYYSLPVVALVATDCFDSMNRQSEVRRHWFQTVLFRVKPDSCAKRTICRRFSTLGLLTSGGRIEEQDTQERQLYSSGAILSRKCFCLAVHLFAPEA